MNSLLIIFLIVVLVIAALIDIRIRKIPNLLTYQTMAVALCYHSLRNGLDGLIFSAGGLILGVVFFILPYLMGGMGAGDAKLMGAVGAVIGPGGVFIACLLTAFVPDRLRPSKHMHSQDNSFRSLHQKMRRNPDCAMA
jgi:prepilin peptidase CpaA